MYTVRVKVATLNTWASLSVQLNCVWSVNTTTAMQLYAQSLAGLSQSYSTLTVPYEFVYVGMSATATGSGLLSVNASTSYFSAHGYFVSYNTDKSTQDLSIGTAKKARIIYNCY